MMKQLLFLVIFILLSNFCESRIFDSATINTSTCKGSLVFKQGNGKLLTLSGDMNVTKIYVESVSMQGCGCYQVFSGRYGKVWFIPSQLKKETKNSCQFFIIVYLWKGMSISREQKHVYTMEESWPNMSWDLEKWKVFLKWSVEITNPSYKIFPGKPKQLYSI